MKIEPKHTMAKDLLEAAWNINRKVNFMTNDGIETDEVKITLKDVIGICSKILRQIEDSEKEGTK